MRKCKILFIAAGLVFGLSGACFAVDADDSSDPLKSNIDQISSRVTPSFTSTGKVDSQEAVDLNN